MLGPSRYFPPVWSCDEDGVLAVGGRLDVDWLLDAYSHGIFPWPSTYGRREVLAWFSPDPRAILELDDLHVPRRVERRIRAEEFTITFDRCFADVITACAAPRRDDGGTWITGDLRRAFIRLHRAGHAHSVEAWQDGALVGGVYGVAIGGLFAGESMFYRVRDASKVALVHLARRLTERGFTLFDIQQATPHMERMGAKLIGRDEYLERLERALAVPARFGSDA